MQYVGVKLGTRVYSYQWYDDVVPMKLGDRVIVPANFVSEFPSFGTVVKLYDRRNDIEYAGELSTLLGKVSEAEDG